MSEWFLPACNPTIDLVGVKAEHLGMPLAVGSILAAMTALRRRSAALAVLAGVLAGMAPGLKQNLVAGLVFASVALVGAWLTGRLNGRTMLGLGAAGVAGATIPVLCQVGWAVVAGVELSSAWYAVYGFRADAAEVLALGDSGAHLDRAAHLLGAALRTGLAIILLLFLCAIRSAWAADPVLTAATTAVVLTEAAMIALAGSYWTVYLFTLVPGAALCVAQLAGLPGRWANAVRAVVIVTVASCVWSLATWSVGALSGAHEFTEHRTGDAIARVARPATPWWSSVGAPISSTPPACPRRTPICGACRCAPSTRATRGSKRC